MNILGLCYIYGLYVTYTSSVLIYGLYVTYAGYFIYIMRVLQVIRFKL